MSDSDALEQIMEPWLEVLDQELARASEPIHTRPLLAAMQFVKEAVVSVEGGTLEDYLEQDWFSGIVRVSTTWYRTKYGAELLAPRATTISAMVQIFGTPFEVRIPETPTRPGTEKGTLVIHFTSGLLDDEDPTDWVENPPNWEAMEEAYRSEIFGELQTVCELTRSLTNGLTGARLSGRQLNAMSDSIRIHLHQGIKGICSNRPAASGISIWELHLVCRRIDRFRARVRCGSPLRLGSGKTVS